MIDGQNVQVSLLPPPREWENALKSCNNTSLGKLIHGLTLTFPNIEVIFFLFSSLLLV